MAKDGTRITGLPFLEALDMNRFTILVVQLLAIRSERRATIGERGVKVLTQVLRLLIYFSPQMFRLRATYFARPMILQCGEDGAKPGEEGDETPFNMSLFQV